LFVWIALASALSHCIAAETNVIFAISNSWRYAQGTNLDAVNWRSPAYDDSSWPSGQGLLAYETCGCLPATIGTTLTTNTNHITFYFRTHFNFIGDTNGVWLLLSNLIDDGAVFYLNGTEIYRVGMAGGAVNNGTLASRTVNNATSFDVFGLPATNLFYGDNVLAVEVHQATASSSDIVFGSGLSSITGLGVVVTRGPYLQWGASASIVARWRTDLATNSRVQFGTNLIDLNFTVDNLASVTEHEVTLTNLTSDTKYYYAIGSTTDVLAGADTNQFFVSAPVPGTLKPTRVWVLGDPGTGTANQTAVRNAYYNFTGTRHTDLWLLLGDNVYENGLDSEYQSKFFNVYPSMLRKSVVWPALGNHDTAGATDFNNSYPYFSIFTLPTNGASGMPPVAEHYYSFDYANVHFVCLDSQTADRSTNGDMADWLRADLAANSNTWTVAYWHHPPYSKGSHDSDLESELVEMRENIVPILEAGGVDLVLCGHSHNYERSFLVDGHYDTSDTLTPAMKLDAGDGRESGNGPYRKPKGKFAHRGTVYVVAGTSGQIGGGTLDHPAMFLSLGNLGSLVLDFDGNRLDARFIRQTGATDDYFTILKTNTPPVANNLAVVVIGDSSTNLVLSGSDTNGDALTFQTVSLPTNGLISSFSPVAGSLIYTPARNYRGQDEFVFRVTDGTTNSAPGSVLMNVVAPADTNSNGLPDDWESAYGVSDPAADTDGDGMSDGKEYIAGTNPTNTDSALRIVSAGVDGNGHSSMIWSAIGGVRYRIEFSSTDGNGDWLFEQVVRSLEDEMNPLPFGVPSLQSFTDDFTLTGGWPTNGARYYRVRVVQ
jgi:hypothetical protein